VAEPIVSVTDSSGPWCPLLAADALDGELAGALRAAGLAEVDLRAPRERDLALVDDALLAADERERDVRALLLLPPLEPVRERGVDSAMVSSPGIGLAPVVPRNPRNTRESP
jgi:hypothetical protein